MTCTENIQYKGFELQISFDYDKGWAGSLEEPPEPESIEIEMVVLLRDIQAWNGFMITVETDITDLLTETQLKEIEQILWSKQKGDFLKCTGLNFTPELAKRSI